MNGYKLVKTIVIACIYLLKTREHSQLVIALTDADLERNKLTLKSMLGRYCFIVCKVWFVYKSLINNQRMLEGRSWMECWETKLTGLPSIKDTYRCWSKDRRKLPPEGTNGQKLLNGHQIPPEGLAASRQYQVKVLRYVPVSYVLPYVGSQIANDWPAELDQTAPRVYVRKM